MHSHTSMGPDKQNRFQNLLEELAHLKTNRILGAQNNSEG